MDSGVWKRFWTEFRWFSLLLYCACIWVKIAVFGTFWPLFAQLFISSLVIPSVLFWMFLGIIECILMMLDDFYSLSFFLQFSSNSRYFDIFHHFVCIFVQIDCISITWNASLNRHDIVLLFATFLDRFSYIFTSSNASHYIAGIVSFRCIWAAFANSYVSSLDDRIALFW